MSEKATLDVIIVGAGLSGLCAARTLAGRGWDVAVVEAADQVGGRTRTVHEAGGPVDIGGQWVGPDQTRMLALLRELGLRTWRQYDRGTHLIRREGRVGTYRSAIPPVPLTQLPSLLLVIHRLDSLARQVPCGRPETAGEAARWDRISVAEWAEREVGSRAVRDLLQVVIHSILCVEPAEVSMLYFLHYIHAAGGLRKLTDVAGGAQELRVEGGTQQIALRLAESLGERVHLSWPVLAIEQDGEQVTLRGPAGTLRARKVILAIPPSQAARLDIRPALRGGRMAALERAAMGSSLKFVARYGAAFWRERGLSGSAICPDGPVQLVFDACDEAVTRPALVGFVMASAARELCGADPGIIRRCILDELTHFFGAEAATPVALIHHAWNEEPWTRGCPVCVRATGGLHAQGRNHTRPEGRIHWAGTESAATWYGFMEGALEAGERAAQEVHQHLCTAARDEGRVEAAC